MDESYQTSSNLETRNSAVNDQTLDDADAINDNIEPTKKARGMSIEYLEVIVVEDYSLALTYMINSMPDYRYRYKKETNDGDKLYYQCKGCNNV